MARKINLSNHVIQKQISNMNGKKNLIVLPKVINGCQNSYYHLYFLFVVVNYYILSVARMAPYKETTCHAAVIAYKL